MTMTDYLCSVEQMRAMAKNLPFIDTIESSADGETRIYYKPVVLNKAIIKGLYVLLRQDGNAYLCQDVYREETLYHPHLDSHKLCSDGHRAVTAEFRYDRIENALYEALIYFNTVNPNSIIHYTPGVFSCSICGEAIMSAEEVVAVSRGELAHGHCLKCCEVCGRLFPPDKVETRELPISGLSLEVCDPCADHLNESACATCIKCHEIVYRYYHSRRDCCYRVEIALSYESAGVDFYLRQRRVYTR